jgi:hypothetical protein
MSVKRAAFAALIMAAGVCVVPAAPPIQKADMADTQAREVVEQFMKAMKAENVDAVMKTVDVPFFWDGVMNIKDQGDLKRHFAEVFEDKDLSQLKYTIKEVHTFAAMREKMDKKELVLLKDVLDNKDRVVVVSLPRDGIAVMVRLRDGKAKVVGFRD